MKAKNKKKDEKKSKVKTKTPSKGIILICPALKDHYYGD